MRRRHKWFTWTNCVCSFFLTIVGEKSRFTLRNHIYLLVTILVLPLPLFTNGYFSSILQLNGFGSKNNLFSYLLWLLSLIFYVQILFSYVSVYNLYRRTTCKYVKILWLTLNASNFVYFEKFGCVPAFLSFGRLGKRSQLHGVTAQNNFCLLIAEKGIDIVFLCCHRPGHRRKLVKNGKFWLN